LVWSYTKYVFSCTALKVKQLTVIFLISSLKAQIE
jgi:hypothetical protein